MSTSRFVSACRRNNSMRLAAAALMAGSTICSAIVPDAPATGPAATAVVALASPFGEISAAAGATTREIGQPCPPSPPPYTGDLDFPSKYEGSGKSRDELNPDAEARYHEATQSIEMFESGLVKLANRHVAGEAGAARCALSWMDRWAGEAALTGPANMTGQAVRQWTLSTMAFSFLQWRDAPELDNARLARIRRWLGNLAEIVKQEQEGLPTARLNNHFYWAAAAVGATGIATGDSALLDWAQEGYRRSVSVIGADGVLPREMARKSRALAYHLYALQPLVMLAEMGRVNGRDLYAENNCALCRLTRLVITGVEDASFFEQQTGARQIVDDPQALAWIAILARACPNDPRLQALNKRLAPFKGRRLGGNLTQIYAHSRKEKPHAIQTQACGHLWR